MKRTLLWLYASIAGMGMTTAAQAELKGDDIYLRNCSACHQADGAGISGAFPALKNNAFVTGDTSQVILVLLNGRGGMPSFNGDITDDEIASVINFIRSDLNDFSSDIIDGEQVRDLKTTERQKMEREG